MNAKEEVRALWKLCFEDSEEFMDLYFSMRYRDEVNRCVRENGKMDAALQTLPYTMTLCGTTVRASYVSGACTHPDWRGQGVMRHLLDETHRRMYADGVVLSLLIPAEEWLFQYYARSGYAPTFHYEVASVKANGDRTVSFCQVQDEIDDVAQREEQYRFFAEMMALRPCCVQHSWDDFRAIIADLRLGNGRLLVARQEGEICGMALGVLEDAHVAIKDLLVKEEVIRLELLRAAAQMFATDEVDCLHPASNDSPCLGMVRIINLKVLLDVWAICHPDDKLAIRIVEDESVPQNVGNYQVEVGRCIQGHPPDKVYREYTMDELATMLLEPEHPFMSLMLN